jgi:hypothetical protein
MNDWNTIREAYLKDHLSKDLKEPQRRVNALEAIERLLKESKPEIMHPEGLKNLGKEGVLQQLLKLKKKPLSSAERSVIVGLFKLL